MRRMGLIAAVGAGVIVAGLACSAGGCIERHVSRHQSGNYVDKNAFARITPGKTSSAMASAMMGDPSSKKKSDTGTEIWVWSYDESRTVDGQFLIIRDSDTTTTSQRASVEVKDGVVVDKWYSARE